jgi:glycosyltransferase involved in cell wall biosynthesis
MTTERISIVTPTLNRPAEVAELLENLSRQSHLPFELVLVDGAPASETRTEQVVTERCGTLPYALNYIRHGGGTAIQRNVGIDAAQGDFIAFIDDDIRLEPDYFERILEVFRQDVAKKVGGIAGYIANQHLDPQKSIHWRWYRRLNLYTTYEPGRYDYQTGYPINRYLRPPHETLVEIDFMGSNCGVWRREVIDSGLRFDPFFYGYGVLEDAHFALRARRQWTLLECGRARCLHLHSPSGRENARLVSQKTAVNYRYVFMDIVPRRTLMQEFRFWRVQWMDFLRFLIYALLHGGKPEWQAVIGKWEGIFMAMRMKI